MTAETETLIDGYGRLPALVHHAVADLTAEHLRWAPKPGANTVGWLVWHLTRIQDDHVADLLDEAQIWTTGTWAADLGLDPDPGDTGYGHTPADVARVQPPSGAALTGYYDAVHDRTVAMLRDLAPKHLDMIVDEAWDPPVTMRVRLVSVLADDLQHAGQAAYVRGLILAG